MTKVWKTGEDDVTRSYFVDDSPPNQPTATVREQLEQILGHDDYKYTDKPTRILAILAAETKRVAIEARIDELDNMQPSEVDTIYHVATDTWCNLENFISARTIELKVTLNKLDNGSK